MLQSIRNLYGDPNANLETDPPVGPADGRLHLVAAAQLDGVTEEGV